MHCLYRSDNKLIRLLVIVDALEFVRVPLASQVLLLHLLVLQLFLLLLLHVLLLHQLLLVPDQLLRLEFGEYLEGVLETALVEHLVQFHLAGESQQVFLDVLD